MRFSLPFTFIAVLAVASACMAAPEIRWSDLPPLPPAAGQSVQPGVASPFVGVHRGALLVAGGANFPDRMPWDGGAKAWWDDVWILEKPEAGDGAARWRTERRFALPRPLAYGISVSTPDGVICAGGSDAERCYADVFLLSWNAQAKELHRVVLPALPEPLANMAGAFVGGTLYVAGGQHVMKGATGSSAFWSLDLKRNRSERSWRRLPSWPGPPRLLAVAVGQRSARGEEVFLFGGRQPNPGRATTLLTDAYAFDPKTGAWRTLPNVGGGAGACTMAATAAACGDREVLIFGGDRGKVFRELEAHDLEIEALQRKAAGAEGAARAHAERAIAEHLGAKRAIYARHPGFSREVLGFDTYAETWRVVAEAPMPLAVTSTAVPWDGGIVIPSGEIRPGVRTSSVRRASVVR